MGRFPLGRPAFCYELVILFGGFENNCDNINEFFGDLLIAFNRKIVFL